MKVGGKHFRTIWLKEGDERVVQLIDQRFLPHRFAIEDVTTVDEMATAIRDMHVRGAGLIGAAAAYGMYLAAVEAAESDSFDHEIAVRAKGSQSERTVRAKGSELSIDTPWCLDQP